MDKKWTTLVPNKQILSKRTGRPLASYTAPKTIGRLPEEAYLLLYYHLPVPDVPNLARCCRKVAALAKDERVWSKKVRDLGWRGPLPEEAERIVEAVREKKRRNSVTVKDSDSVAAPPRASQQYDTSNGHPPSTPSRKDTRGTLVQSSPNLLLPQSPTRDTPSKERSGISVQRRQSVNGRRSSLLGSSQSKPAAKTAPMAATPTIPELDDGFGEFVDFSDEGQGSTGGGIDSSAPVNSGLGLSDGFASIDLLDNPVSTRTDEPLPPSLAIPPLQSTAKRKKDEDLLMLFDDDDIEDIGQATASPVKPKTRPSSSSVSSTLGTLLGTKEDQKPAGLHHHSSPSPSYDVFSILYQQLLPYFVSLQSHSTSSLVFTRQSLQPLARARLLATLKNFLCPHLAATRSATTMQVVRRNVLSSIDFFESSMLQKFDKAFDAADLDEMRDLATICWELNEGHSLCQVFFNKIELFYENPWDPHENLTKQEGPNGDWVDAIDFSAMDAFVNHVLEVAQKEGYIIAKIFPPNTDVLVQFNEKIMTDIMTDYISTLLDASQDLAKPLFLLTTAAAFAQSSRIVDTIMDIRPASDKVTRDRLVDHVYTMFEPHMHDYLCEEQDWTKELLSGICKEWDEKLAQQQASADPTFLTSQNPQQVKRNVMASFTKALLLPVTISTKTVAFGVNAITAGGTMAFNAFSSGLGGTSTPSAEVNKTHGFPLRDDDTIMTSRASTANASTTSLSNASINNASSEGNLPDGLPHFNAGFHMLLSIDTAVQLIQADRDCLKRIQTFQGYTGHFAKKIRQTIEEIFITLCQILSVNHLLPAFAKATNQMGLYKPAEHEVDESVLPLVQFFELVHVGDTIAQMVQVYYDTELARYVDKNDFLSVVVREKKKFENSLDEAVASGLNAGVQILMTQAEYILQTQQDPRDFAPAGADEQPGTPISAASAAHKRDKSLIVDIEGPTRAAVAVVACLRSHCNMLKGSTDKAILEVFHQEVALRLHGILLKHLKRSIVSVAGGFQVIADINLYSSFIASLKVPNVAPYFTALKMVANVFIIDSPRDLGMMARDLDRYEGTLRIEDIMELVHCRTDWKKIEREVEKEVFGFKAEDCIVQ